MNSGIMRKIDFYLGTVLCFVLSVVNVAARYLRRAPSQPPRQIVLLKFWGIGSILLTGPALRSLREAFPDVQLLFVTFDSNRQVVELLNEADEIYTLRTSGLLRFITDTIALIGQLRRMEVDAVVDFEFFSKYTMIFSYLIGAPMRVGFEFTRIYRGRLLTHPVYYNHYRHTAEIFLALARKLGGAPAKPIHPLVKCPEQWRMKALEALASNEVPLDRDIAVINATVSADKSSNRQWEPDRFAAVAGRLATQDAMTIVLTGAPGDESYVEKVAAKIGASDKVFNLAGKTDFAELVGILAHARLLISCDSGPVHIAVSLRRPVVALYGPETPQLYGPTTGNYQTIYKDPYCSPCMTVYNYKISNCTNDRKCMKLITVDEVYKAARKVLAAETSARGLLPDDE